MATEWSDSMKTQFVIALCLACAASSATAQIGPGGGAVGSMGGNGAITNIGAGGYGARTQPPADLRPSTPAATDTPPSSAATPAGNTVQAPAAASTTVLQGAVWGSAPANPDPAPTGSIPTQGQN
ncbi:MAG: hypothetical protein E6H54_21430 [Betaproteobacteria bacterium]|nr:MAG: hypothetical protein E6H54_21430 [Betaproteobacteria bacterium]